GWGGTEGTFQIGVFPDTGPPPAPDNNECVDATDLSNLTGGAVGTALYSDTFTNVAATNEEDLDGLDCWDTIGIEPVVTGSTWYSFTGDGNMYFIRTSDCDGGDIDHLDDTQLGIFTGTCTNLTQVACNEDIDFPNNIWEA